MWGVRSESPALQYKNRRTDTNSFWKIIIIIIILNTDIRWLNLVIPTFSQSFYSDSHSVWGLFLRKIYSIVWHASIHTFHSLLHVMLQLLIQTACNVTAPPYAHCTRTRCYIKHSCPSLLASPHMSDQLYFELYIWGPNIKRARLEIQGNTHCFFVGCVKIGQLVIRKRMLTYINKACNQLNSQSDKKKGGKINVLNKLYSFKMLACKCETSAFLL